MNSSGFPSMDEVNENTAEGYRSILALTGRRQATGKISTAIRPGARRTEAPMSRQGIWTGFSPHCAAACSWEGKSPHPFSGRTARLPDRRTGMGFPDCGERNGYAFEFLMQDSHTEPFCMYKDGQNAGVSAKVSYYPERDISLILLSNQDCKCGR